MNVEITSEDKTLLLLNTLPDSYENLITTLLYEKSEIRFEDVSKILINNENRKLDKKVHQVLSSNVVVQDRPETRIKVDRKNLILYPRRNILKMMSTSIVRRKMIGKIIVPN